MTYFISDHRDVTKEEFEKYYIPAIEEAFITGGEFVVGDYWGVDEMAQEYLDKLFEHPSEKYSFVTVYHMFEKPNRCVSEHFNTCGGFKNDEERDSAMTKASDIDIAFVRKGKRNSGTAQNIVRRYEFE